MRAYGAKHSDHQFKFHQYQNIMQVRADSPNLMLTKIIQYMQIMQQPIFRTHELEKQLRQLTVVLFYMEWGFLTYKNSTNSET